MNTDYLSHIRDALVQPLASQGVEGVQEVVALMDTYYLMKEDFENIMEISSWGGKPSPFSRLDPKVSYQYHPLALLVCNDQVWPGSAVGVLQGC